MALIRGHHSFDDHFTQIPNEWLRDNRLSLKAIGLLAQIMSHKPGWNLSIRTIARFNDTGLGTIKSAVEELEKFGYLKRSDKQGHKDDGTFGNYDWITQDPFQNPDTVKSHHGEIEHKEEHPIKNNIEKETITQNKFEQTDFDEFWKRYPRKVAKGEAKKAFIKALKLVPLEKLLEATESFGKDPNLPSAQFIPYAATWLNRESWDDGPLPERVLSFEEKKDYQAKQSARQTDAMRRAAQEAVQQSQEAAKHAAPPPKCKHGKTLALCMPCLKKLS